MRIAVARFSHETYTFSPNTTTLTAWEKRGIHNGADARALHQVINNHNKTANP